MYEESGGRAAPVLADRYRLLAQVGRGGTARVLRARDERLDREVAIKIFQPHADPVGRWRFEDEARLLAGFDHPGLVKVYDSGCAGGEPYLVLELIDGPQLGRLIDEGRMPADEVRRIGIGVAEALAYVHSRGVVHRDVKPGNVLLSHDGRPHLADFGLAKLLARSGITASDRLVGTAAYLSPEQVLGTEVGPAADIYGLGLVLLECLTGEIEYPGLDAETVLARLNRRPRIPDTVPPALAEAIEAMTRLEPEERPDAATCAEMLRADRPSAVAPSRPRRRFFSPKAAAIAGAGLVAGLAVLLFTPPPPEDNARPGQVRPDTGLVINSNLEPSTAPARQSEQRQQPRPAADQRTVVTETVVKTAPPTSTTTETVPETVDTPLVADDPTDPADPDKTKKPKKTKTRTKEPKADR